MQQKIGQPVKFDIDRADARGHGGVDYQGAAHLGSIPFRQPYDPVTAYFDARVCAHREILGGTDWL